MKIDYFTHLIILFLEVSWMLKKLNDDLTFYFENRGSDQDIREVNLEIYIQNMRKYRVWRTILEIIAFLIK